MKASSISILETLKKAGHQAYWAGGCVRDMLLGIEPKDFDIVTSAKPEEIENLLEHTIPIGKQFGVINAIVDGHHFEIATFRSDSGYSDGRRPDAILFSNAEEDAKRRDFTINSMFYDPLTDTILDFEGGQKDLKDQLIRFIGDPEQRILEDHLRILRAVRFKNNFQMQYHPDTYEALKKHCALIQNVSKERIADELNKMIINPQRPGQAFEEMYELGILELIIPELCSLKGLAQPKQYHQEGDVWDHSLMALNALTDEDLSPDPLPANTPSLELKWAVLLHDIGKYETFSIDNERIRYDHHAEVGAQISVEIFERLKYSRKFIEKVKWLIGHHMMIVQLMEMPDGRRRHWFLMPDFPDLLEVYRADALGITPTDMSLYQSLLKLYRHEIAELKLMPKQLIDGDELMKLLSIPPGPQVGKILEAIREAQLAREISTRSEAIELAKSIIKSQAN